MKILYVDLDREWRGGQSQALLTVTGLRACGVDAQLLAVRDYPLARRAEAAGVPIHTVGPRARRFAAAWSLSRLLAKQEFHLVHVNEPHALTSAWLGHAQRKVPVVASRRVAYPISQNFLALNRYLATSRIIAISRFVEASLLNSGIPAEQMEIVYEGVDVPSRATAREREQARSRWGINVGNVLVGCVGYLLPEKGQEQLLLALPAVRAKYPEVRLLLAGDGPCRKMLETLARDSAQQDAVVFAGFVEDMRQVYAALDIFAFPSLAEPLGTSLLAAMAWGLPVVAVASGGVPEYVQHEINGLLATQAESSLLSEALLRLLVDKALTHRIGSQARRKIEDELSARHMVQGTMRAYERALAEKKSQ